MSTPGPVVLFCAGLHGDGVARNTVNLANALSRRGHAVEILALEGGTLAAQLAPEVRLRLVGRPARARGLALALAVPALRRGLRAARPSVLVSMGNHAHLAAWAALRGRPGLPRVYRISNDACGAGRPGPACVLRRALQRLIADDATAILAVSPALAEAAPFRADARDGRLSVLANGVDVEAARRRGQAAPRHPWLDDGLPFVVAVGRLHPQKNYAAALEALAVARRTDPHLRLLILGGARGREARRLAAQARARGLAAAVRFEGEVADPFPFLARARAYLLASRWEGACNSLLEAMACGAPVVASRTAGNAREVLAEGRYGLLVDPDSPDDIAEALLRQTGPRPVTPAGRADAFSLARVLDRACGLVLSARRADDGIQTFAAAPRNRGRLFRSLRGTATEYRDA